MLIFAPEALFYAEASICTQKCFKSLLYSLFFFSYIIFWCLGERVFALAFILLLFGNSIADKAKRCSLVNSYLVSLSIARNLFTLADLCDSEVEHFSLNRLLLIIKRKSLIFKTLLCP